MSDLFSGPGVLLVFLAVWLLLQAVILPRMGVET